jgi:hypothetical protein
MDKKTKRQGDNTFFFFFSLSLCNYVRRQYIQNSNKINPNFQFDPVFFISYLIQAIHMINSCYMSPPFMFK